MARASNHQRLHTGGSTRKSISAGTALPSHPNYGFHQEAIFSHRQDCVGDGMLGARWTPVPESLLPIYRRSRRNISRLVIDTRQSRLGSGCRRVSNCRREMRFFPNWRYRIGRPADAQIRDEDTLAARPDDPPSESAWTDLAWWQTTATRSDRATPTGIPHAPSRWRWRSGGCGRSSAPGDRFPLPVRGVDSSLAIATMQKILCAGHPRAVL